jgi:hypothetical protein
MRVLFPFLGTLSVGWKKNSYNIGVKQGFHLSANLFGIYIDKLEYWLEDVCFTSLTLACIVIILLIYVDDIVLMEMKPYDLGKNLRILKEF